MPQSNSLTRSPQSHTQSSGGEIRNADLAILITSLAENASQGMAPLYSLHTALFGAYGANSQQVQLFAKAKGSIKQEWEIWLSFLRRSMAYSRNFIALCNSLQTDGRAIAASMIVSDAGQLLNEANACKRSYINTVQRFASLSQMYNPPPRGRRKPIHNLPIVLRAFAASQAVLESSGRCFDSIVTFWSDHSSYVSKLSTSQTNIEDLIRSGGLRAQIDLWMNIHNSLRRAASDITAYCDALTVVPIGPSRTKRGRFRERLADISADSRASQPPKIQEAGYYEVLTAPNQYDMAGLVKASSKVRARCQAIIKETTENDHDPLLDIRRQSGRYLSTASTVSQLADNGQAFYSGACKISQSSPLTALRTRAVVVRTSIQTLLNEYDGIFDRLSATAIHSVSRGREAKVFGLVLALVDDLQHLIGKLEDLDNFWFGLTAGVEFLQQNRISSVGTDVATMNAIWRRQEAEFGRYSAEAASMNPAQQSPISRAGGSGPRAPSVQERAARASPTSFFCCLRLR